MKKYILILSAILAKYFLKATLLTCRISYSGLHHLKPHQSISICLWHEKLLLIPLLKSFTDYFPDKVLMPVLSGSKDGDLFNQTILSGIRAIDRPIRVHSAKKHDALKSMCKQLKLNKVLVITPDGPNGPPQIIKPGALFSSQVTKTPLLLMSWTSNRVWKAPTWDKLQIPIPFSRIKVTIDGPYYVEKGACLENASKTLSQRLIQIDR